MRTRDEDQSLRDDSDLQVDNHVQLRVVVINAIADRFTKANAELALEERCFEDNANQGYTAKGKSVG